MPLLGCSSQCLVECQVLGLCLQIQLGIGNRGVRQTDFYVYLIVLTGGIVQTHDGTRTFNLCTGFQAVALIKHIYRCRCLVEHSIEIHRYGGACLIFLHIFRLCNHIALDGVAVDLMDIGILHSATLTLAVTDVEQNVRRPGCWERVALETHACCGCEFGFYLIVFQQYRIVAGMSCFAILVEARAETFVGFLQLARHRFYLACNRHERDAANLKLVQTGESVDRGVTILVANGFPSLIVAIGAIGRGAQFGHAERFGSGRVEEPTTVNGAQIGLHIVNQRFVEWE